MMAVLNALMLVVMLAPIVLVVWISFTPTSVFVVPLHSFSLRWYREALSYPGFVDAFLLSLRLAVLSALGAVSLSFLAAYGLVRFRPPGRGALLAFFTSPLLVPGVVFGVAALQYVNTLGLYNTLTGLLLAHAVLVVPYAVRSLEVTLRGVPQELEWAAQSLGASRARMLWTVTLPLCARGLVAAFLFCFLLSFSEVTVTIFMTGPQLLTLPIRIYSYMSDRIDPVVAAVSSAVVLVSLVLVGLLSLFGGLPKVVKE